MHLDQEARIPRALHQPVPAPVVEIKNSVLISGIDLGASHPGFDQLLEVALPAILEARDIQVKAVIDKAKIAEHVKAAVDNAKINETVKLAIDSAKIPDQVKLAIDNAKIGNQVSKKVADVKIPDLVMTEAARPEFLTAIVSAVAKKLSEDKEFLKKLKM